jgi:DHA1 family bicyclomycin/chloramphenicol resistance-like MFS transporter
MRTTWRHLRVLARDRRYVGATVSSSLTSASYFAYLAGAPFVLQEIYGLEPTQFAFVFAVNAAGFATFGFLAGRASERWGERRVFAGGLVLIATGGSLLVVIWVAALPLVVTVGAFFLVAAGAAAVSPPSTTLALVDYPEYAGTASSILGVARFAAGAIAAPLVGLGGALTMGPLAVIVLGTALGASAVFAWLIGPPRSAGRRNEHPPRHDDSLRETN